MRELVDMCILIDTREQLPYRFQSLGHPVYTRVTGIPTGDYSVKGYTDRVCVERKTLPDLFGSFGQGRARFKREFARMAEMDHAALVIEAGFKDCFLDPPKHTKMSPKAVFRSCLSWAVKYGVHVHWCGSRSMGEKITYLLLKNWWRHHASD